MQNFGIMKKCKWCDKEYDIFKKDQYRMENNLQYFWDVFDYCSLECCRKGWESEEVKNSGVEMIDFKQFKKWSLQKLAKNRFKFTYTLKTGEKLFDKILIDKTYDGLIWQIEQLINNLSIKKS